MAVNCRRFCRANYYEKLQAAGIVDGSELQQVLPRLN